MELVMSAATDCGTVRKENEDFFYYSKKKKLVIVCDGMGGHRSGALASKIAGETVRDVFLYPDLAELMRFSQDFNERLPVIALRLIIGIRLANRRLRLLAESDEQMRGMGTTIAAMAFSEHWACVTHVGDSRVYYFHKKNLRLITEDHSWINELLQDREIRAEEAKHFRKKNVLTRALGTHPTVKIDVQWFPINGSGKFLLCSDGLHNALNSEHITKFMQDDNDSVLQSNVEQLVQRAKVSNGSDNITAAVVCIKNAPDKAANGAAKKVTVPEEPEKNLEMEDRFLRTLYAEDMKSKSLRGHFGFSRGRVAALGLAGIAVAAIAYGLLRTETPETNEAAQPATAKHEMITSLQSPGAPPTTVARKDSPWVSSSENAPALKTLPAASTRLAGGDGRKTNAASPPKQSPLPTELQPAPAAASLVPHSGGRIFLPGLQHQRYAEALVCVDDQPLGRVKNLAENGFILKPGKYLIAIKDTTGRVLHQKANVNVVKGDVKTLEFKD